jgi:hypothetical protein
VVTGADRTPVVDEAPTATVDETVAADVDGLGFVEAAGGDVGGLVLDDEMLVRAPHPARNTISTVRAMVLRAWFMSAFF